MPFSTNSRNKTRPYYITPAKRRHAFRPTLTRISSSISGTLDRRSTRPLDRSTPLQQFPNASRNVTRGPFPFFHSHSTSFSPFPLHHQSSPLSLAISHSRTGDGSKSRKTAETRLLSYPSSSYFKSDGLAFCMQRTLAWVVGIDPRRGMWVISIAAEIGPITPATIERCNYSATNDKKKKRKKRDGGTKSGSKEKMGRKGEGGRERGKKEF